MNLDNTDRIIIRQAEISDIDFIIEAILEADRSDTDRISYCTIFNLSRVEFRKILREILIEDIQGSELCLSDFLVATVEGETAGACCSWIEAIDGNPSYLIKYSLLSQYLSEDNIEYSKGVGSFIKGLHIDREKQTLQIESVYVNPNFRGLGISGRIINEHFRQKKLQYPDLEKAQLIVTDENSSAISAYKKIGFNIIQKFKIDNEMVLKILPSNSLVLMEKNLK